MSNALQWRHNERDGVSNHRHLDCLLNRLFWRRLKKTSKLRVTGLCEGNSPVTGEFPSQRASNAENVSIRWRHHGKQKHHWAELVAGFVPRESTKAVGSDQCMLSIIVLVALQCWCYSKHNDQARMEQRWTIAVLHVVVAGPTSGPVVFIGHHNECHPRQL